VKQPAKALIARFGNLAVTTPPEAAICKECDLRMLCRSGGILSRPEALA
jgi:hypothetical protein